MYLLPQPKILELRPGALTYSGDGIRTLVRTECSGRLRLPESYRITVDQSGVLIDGADEAGLYYGRVTLGQILLNYKGYVPYLQIYDEPEFSYRGFMIDPCRHFFTVAEIKKMIDAAALFKFNYFHFHLSDDQGFRVQIDSWPLLTSVGSARRGSAFGRGENDSNVYAHYYTKDELRELVSYCAEKHIVIIPEIDMPGHSSAILAAYPELSCRGEAMEPEISAGVFPNILCAGNEKTYQMIYDVVDELCEIFPGEYFHIGGDETPKIRWNECEKCRAEKKRLGLSDMNALQGYMMNEVSAYLKTKGKKAICWNESLRGKNLTADNTLIAFWMDSTDDTARWANHGGRVISESFKPYYADYPYGMYPLKAVYEHDPRKLKGFDEMGQNSVVGVESPIWTEYVTNFQRMSYLCFPRWLAVADTAWNGNDRKDYARFKRTVAFYCNVLREMGHFPAPERDWDLPPHKKAAQTLGFFHNLLTGANVRLTMQTKKAEKKQKHDGIV